MANKKDITEQEVVNPALSSDSKNPITERMDENEIIPAKPIERTGTDDAPAG